MAECGLLQGRAEIARRPVSRVLSRLAAGMTIHLGRPLPDASCDLPGRQRGNPPGADFPKKTGRLPPLHGLAPGGVCRAATVTGRAVARERNKRRSSKGAAVKGTVPFLLRKKGTVPVSC